MQINRNNFEEYIIDFVDGNLNPSQEEDVRVFLRNNPDISEEVKGLGLMILVPETVSHPRKENLFKQDAFCGVENRFDYLCIAKVENDLSKEEGVELGNLLNTNTYKELTRFEWAKLITDMSVGYNNKSNLKRYPVSILSRNFIVLVTSAAAIALILFGVFSTLTIPSLQTPSEISAVPSIIKQPIVKAENLEEMGDVFKETTIPIHSSKEVTKATQQVYAHQAKNEEEYIEEARTQELIQRLTRISIDKIPVRSQAINIKPILANVSFESAYDIEEQLVFQSSPPQTRVIGFFEIAQMGLNRLSELTGSEINLDADKDANGNIKKIKFESKLFALSVPTKRKK